MTTATKKTSRAISQHFLPSFFANVGVPVLAGFPAGHDHYNLTLPMGGRIKMDADQQRVTLLENCVTAV